jgi:hypothetical protein
LTAADLDGSYSIDTDPIVAAISDRLSRETNSSEHRFSLPNDFRSSGYGSLSSAFDNDSASDSCIGYDRTFSSLTGKSRCQCYKTFLSVIYGFSY